MCSHLRVCFHRLFSLVCGAVMLGAGEGALVAQHFFPLPTQEKEGAEDELPPWQERGLRSALADPSPEVRSLAVEFIAGTRWAARLLSPEVVQPLLQSSDEKIRVRAARALGGRAAQGTADFKELLPLLHSQDLHVVHQALDAMQRLGPAAGPHARELLPLLESPDEQVRRHAVETLGDLGPAATMPHASALVPLLRDEKYSVIEEAAKVLGLLGREDAAAIVPLLLPCLPPKPEIPHGPAASRAPAGDPFGLDPPAKPAAPSEPAGDPFGLDPPAKPAAPSAPAGDPFGADPPAKPAAPESPVADPSGAAPPAAPPVPETAKADPFGPTPATASAEAPPGARPMRAMWPKDEIVKTLGGMGPAAIPLAAPALAELLTDADSFSSRPVMLALSRLGYVDPAATARALLPLLQGPKDDPNLKEVVDFLGLLDPEVAPVVVPALLPLLQPEPQPQEKAERASGFRDHVVGALGHLSSRSDSAAVGALLQLLTSPEAGMRHAAAYALRNTGAQARPQVVRALLPRLKDADSSVRASAIHALTETGRDIVPKEISDALRSLVKDPRSRARDHAFYELDHLRDSGQSLMGRPTLAQLQKRLPGMLEHATPEVRAQAAEALAQAISQEAEEEPVTPEILHAILPLLTHDGFSERVSILDALELVPPGTPEAPQILSALRPLLQEPEGRVRAAAAVILHRQGLDATTCIRAVKPLLQSSSILDQENALGAYEALAPDLPAEEVVPALIPMLKIPIQVLCLTAADILQNLGPKIDPYAPEILALFQHPHKTVKWAAAMALSHPGPDIDALVVRALLAWIKTDPEMQTLAVNMLGNRGPAVAPQALPLLAPLLHLKDDPVRTRVAIALGRMGPAAAPAAKDLIAVLDDIDPTQGFSGQDPQYPAAEALGLLGPGVAPIVLPALLACFEKDDSILGYHASLALQSLGPQFMPAMLSAEMARWHQAGAPPAKSWSLHDLDLWGNRTSDPACHCAALAALLEFAGSAPAQRLRFHLHYWSGHSQELLLSLRWLGRPAADPMPANGAEQQAVLHMLLTLWPHSVAFPALRAEMAGRIGEVAQSLTAAPEEKVAELLMKTAEALKADTVKESQPASAKAQAALQSALARGKGKR